MDQNIIAIISYNHDISLMLDIYIFDKINTVRTLDLSIELTESTNEEQVKKISQLTQNNSAMLRCQ